MISPERSEFNKAVRELNEMAIAFNEKVKSSIITLLLTQPENKIVFKKDKPKMVKDTENGKITLATISAIWVCEGSLLVQAAWKEGSVSFNEPWNIDMELDDVYHNIFWLTSAIQEALKDKENPLTTKKTNSGGILSKIFGI